MRAFAKLMVLAFLLCHGWVQDSCRKHKGGENPNGKPCTLIFPKLEPGNYVIDPKNTTEIGGVCKDFTCSLQERDECPGDDFCTRVPDLKCVNIADKDFKNPKHRKYFETNSIENKLESETWQFGHSSRCLINLERQRRHKILSLEDFNEFWPHHAKTMRFDKSWGKTVGYFKNHLKRNVEFVQKTEATATFNSQRLEDKLKQIYENFQKFQDKDSKKQIYGREADEKLQELTKQIKELREATSKFINEPKRDLEEL